MSLREEEIPGQKTVAVLGLGQLGNALALAFARAGHRTVVWNRSAGKADPAVAAGAVRRDTVADAVGESRLVVVCVSDYEAVRAVLDQAGDAVRGQLVVNLSSGTPELARELADLVAGRGADYVDGAAMSGTRLVGESDALFLFSGSPGAFETYRDVLAGLGKAMFLGADPGLASLYDTALFGVAWGALSGFYHALALMQAEGVGPTAFAEVAGGHMPFLARLMADHAEQIRQGHYPSDDGTVDVHAAAMAHLVDASKAHGVATDFPMFVTELLGRTAAAGHAGKGVASTIEVMR